ncbi:hypothetical protein [Kitasatospora sp. NPDC005751]|uniref:hypothetical protein n=1 Tax=unclassified Kitasatospora TaxID=2633591 RepID=UPI0033D6EBD1
MPEVQSCAGCGGSGGTEKTEATVELDEEGGMVPKLNTFWSPCSRCHGSGTVIVG